MRSRTRARLLWNLAWLIGLFSACESSDAERDRDAASMLEPDTGSPAGDAGSTRPDASGSDDGGAAQSDGAADIADCLKGVTAPAAGFIEIQAFSSVEHGVYIERARQPGQRSAVGETSPYDLKIVAITADDDAACVQRAADLRYEFGHHNWDEVWSVRTTKARYVGRERYGFDDPQQPWTDTLEARALADDALLWGPIPLSEEGCRTLPYNLNPCLMRERIDEPPADWGNE
jgi:hypothetical protein